MESSGERIKSVLLFGAALKESLKADPAEGARKSKAPSKHVEVRRDSLKNEIPPRFSCGGTRSCTADHSMVLFLGVANCFGGAFAAISDSTCLIFSSKKEKEDDNELNTRFSKSFRRLCS
jgi:hypothetical protein